MNILYFLVGFLVLAQILTAIGLFLLWRKGQAAPPDLSVPERDSVSHRELQMLERELSVRLEALWKMIDYSQNLFALLFAGGTDAPMPRQKDVSLQESLPPDTSMPWQENVSLQESLPPDALPTVPVGTPIKTAEEIERKLQGLLDEPVFNKNVWPRMRGSFDEARRVLLDYLGRYGQPEPIVEPYPPLENNQMKHWTFIYVRAHGGESNGRGYLFPKYFERYDSTRYLHFFDVQSVGEHSESFITELISCCVLNSGDMKANISSVLVEKRGKIGIGARD